MKILIVLSEKNWQEVKERKNLSHDGGKLLLWMLDRISIPRENWVHTYAYEGVKKNIPKVAWERKAFLIPSVSTLVKFVEVNYPCSVVAMGRLARECLLYPPVSKKKEGAEWDVSIPFRRIGLEHAWVTYMPDAALYAPALAVEIAWVLAQAAKEAGIPTKINYELKSFRNWYRYWK